MSESTNRSADLDLANSEVFERLCTARPMLVGMSTAREVIPGMDSHLVLHAGPPVTWQKMAPAMRAAVCGGLVFEGLAASIGEAEMLAASGAIRFAPAHDINLYRLQTTE